MVKGFQHIQLIMVLALIVSLPTTKSNAADLSVHASLMARAAISATANSEMNFGEIIFEPSHSGDIILDTNGNVTLDQNSYGLALSGNNTAAGEVVLSGANDAVVEISCETQGLLTSSAGGDLNLSAIEVALNAGVSHGQGAKCNGLGNAVKTVEFSDNASQKLLMGGVVKVGSGAITQSSQFSTASNGGSPVRVRITYQ